MHRNLFLSGYTPGSPQHTSPRVGMLESAAQLSDVCCPDEGRLDPRGCWVLKSGREEVRSKQVLPLAGLCSVPVFPGDVRFFC